MTRGEPATVARAPSAGRTRVLVVEDLADNRELLVSLLEHWGHEVFAAGDGADAVRLALQVRPDVALIDVGLPGLNGYDVAARLRAADPAWRPLLAAVTGYGAAADRRRARQAGFDLHLVKPVNLSMLERLLAAKSSAVHRAG